MRYRYYVSQAVLQSRKDRAGAVCRVPAPDVEAVIERFARERWPGSREGLEDLLAARIARVIVLPAHIEVTLRSPNKASENLALGSREDGAADQGASMIIVLPWSKKPFRADKGIASTLTPTPEEADKAKENILQAIGKSRRWVGRLTGGETLDKIAREEGRSERHIRNLLLLAFVSPHMLRDILGGGVRVPNIVAFAKGLPLTWTPTRSREPARIGLSVGLQYRGLS